ncbi:hypothetical protein V1505DRAFT_60064 [Lipomyces doorenjongii]
MQRRALSIRNTILCPKLLLGSCCLLLLGRLTGPVTTDLRGPGQDARGGDRLLATRCVRACGNSPRLPELVALPH